MYNRRKGGYGNGRDRRQEIGEVEKRRKERKKHENENCEAMAQQENGV